MDSDIDAENGYNWLKVILRKPGRAVHPLRHIMLMFFLFGSVEEFFRYSLAGKNDMKELVLYPCLNPVCNHYNKNVIPIEQKSFDSKSKKYIGTYRCTCGFEYSKAISRSDYNRIRVKNYGDLWERKLKELICEGNNSIRSIARALECDSKTVKKYAIKFGLRSVLNVDEDNDNTNAKANKLEQSIVEAYKQSIIQFISLNPNCLIKDIRAVLGKEYIWLYRHEKTWLTNLPLNQKRSIVSNARVDWERRDREIVGLLNAEYRRILGGNIKERITISMLGRRLNIQSFLEKRLNKLPNTSQLLKEICETIDDFQKRRIRYVISMLKENEQELKKWKIIRLAGIRAEYIHNLDKYIEDKIKSSTC